MHDVRSATIRPRGPQDVPACAALASRLRDSDGYPAFMPSDDFERFVAPDDLLGAFVAVLGGDVVGHVALRRSSAPAATELATAALGLDAERLGFVARLMVAPEARRRSVGRRLLATAVSQISSLGRVAVLDVLTRDAAAIALYEHEGWIRLGETSFTSRSGAHFDEIVFLAPAQREPPGTPGA